MGGKTFMFIQAKQRRRVRRDPSDLQNDHRWDGKWTRGWTNFEIFSMGGKTFLFRYKAVDGTAEFHEIRSASRNTIARWKKWATGWTALDLLDGRQDLSVPLQGRQRRRRVPRDPQRPAENEVCLEGKRTRGSTSLQIFPMT
jgi:hypothetical protein